MISAHKNMPEISVNYFCVENNYFFVALCYQNVFVNPINLAANNAIIGLFVGNFQFGKF